MFDTSRVMKSRWLLTAGSLVGIVTLVVAAAIPLLARNSASGERLQKVSAVDSAVVTPLEPKPGETSGVRTLPVGLDQGRLAELFPDGEGLDDTERLRDAIRELAAVVGLGDSIDELITTEVVSLDPETYPYSYEPIDSMVRSHLDLEAARDEPDTVVELGTLLIVLAVDSSQQFAGDIQMPAGVAYSILDAVRQTSNTCDIQTDLLYAMSLGVTPVADNVRAEVEAAVSLCPDDPTPQWIEARYLTQFSQVHGYLPIMAEAPSQWRSMASDSFVKLRKDFPDSPLGWAGEADLLLLWADDAESVGDRPFQVREWRRQAADLYTVARSKSADPLLLVGQARALSALDRDDEAVRLIRRAVELVPGDLPARIVLGQVLVAAGRYQQAADAIAGESDFAPHWWMLTDALPSTIALSGGYAAGLTMLTTIYDATWQGFGGADTEDLEFVPTSRGYPTPPACRDLLREEALILAGKPEKLSSFEPLNSPLESSCLPTFGKERADPYLMIPAIAGPESERQEALSAFDASSAPDGDLESYAWDLWQDLLRSAGELEAAEKVAGSWTEAMPDDGDGWQRFGEVLLLQDDAAAAVPALTKAVELLTERAEGNDTGGGGEETPRQLAMHARIQLGFALAESGKISRARAELRKVADAPMEEGFWDAKLHMYAFTQIGMLDFRDKDWSAAAEAFRSAIELGEPWDGVAYYGASADTRSEVVGGGMLRGAQENNLALALAKLGKSSEAVEAATSALNRDPRNPVFLDTLAFAHQLGGDPAKAATAYQKAVGADPSSYVSANNLAVILAQSGQDDHAERLLKESLAANPRYATAWHNLGVLRARSWSPTTFLSGQGALGKAGALDRDLRGASLDLRVDDEIYKSGLDVSKPLTPDWSYASSASSTGRNVTISMIILLLIRMVKVIGLERIGATVAERVVASASGNRRTMWFWRRLRTRWAVALSFFVLGGAALWGASSLGDVALLATVGALVVAPLGIRMAFARVTRQPVRHFAWTPALALGAAGTPFGLAFVPFPSMDASRRRPNRLVLWIVPVLLAVLGVWFAVMTLTTSVPFARDLAGAVLVLLASILTPVPPMDGAHLPGRVANIAVTAALVLATLGLALHWI